MNFRGGGAGRGSSSRSGRYRGFTDGPPKDYFDEGDDDDDDDGDGKYGAGRAGPPGDDGGDDDDDVDPLDAFMQGWCLLPTGRCCCRLDLVFDFDFDFSLGPCARAGKPCLRWLGLI